MTKWDIRRKACILDNSSRGSVHSGYGGLAAGQEQQEETVHLQPEALSREQWEVGEAIHSQGPSPAGTSSSQASPPKGFTSSSNSHHQLRTKVRMPEPVRTFLIQITAMAVCTYFHLLKTEELILGR